MYGSRLLHGHQTEYLEQMVLHYVSNNAKVVEIPTTAFGAERFFECDLHLRDIVPVPSGVQYSISKPKQIISYINCKTKGHVIITFSIVFISLCNNSIF